MLNKVLFCMFSVFFCTNAFSHEGCENATDKSNHVVRRVKINPSNLIFEGSKVHLETEISGVIQLNSLNYSGNCWSISISDLSCNFVQAFQCNTSNCGYVSWKNPPGTCPKCGSRDWTII